MLRQDRREHHPAVAFTVRALATRALAIGALAIVAVATFHAGAATDDLIAPAPTAREVTLQDEDTPAPAKANEKKAKTETAGVPRTELEKHLEERAVKR